MADSCKFKLDTIVRDEKAGTLTTAVCAFTRTHTYQFLAGAGSGQVDRILHHSVNVPASAIGAPTVDLLNYTDRFGQTGQDITYLKGVLIANLGTDQSEYIRIVPGTGKRLPWRVGGFADSNSSDFIWGGDAIWRAFGSDDGIEISNVVNNEVTFDGQYMSAAVTLEYLFVGVAA